MDGTLNHPAKASAQSDSCVLTEKSELDTCRRFVPTSDRYPGAKAKRNG